MDRFITLIAFIVALSPCAFGQAVCSSFDPAADRCDLTAAPVAQAKCLLRPIKKFANLGAALTELPAPLDTLVGQPMQTITLEQLKAFLTAKAISETDVGGSVSIPLTKPRYFVIHDTSDFLGDLNFPANINDASWPPNTLTRRVTRPVAHIYINRLGQSATAVVFESSSPPSGTKFGLCNPNQKSAFLHIENIQPRIRDRSVRFNNDAIAPTPGFTTLQLERLALIYIVASVRSGKWLIPGYHSPIDLGFRDRHDDPQNFDLEVWAAKVGALVEEIRAVR